MCEFNLVVHKFQKAIQTFTEISKEILVLTEEYEHKMKFSVDLIEKTRNDDWEKFSFVYSPKLQTMQRVLTENKKVYEILRKMVETAKTSQEFINTFNSYHAILANKAYFKLPKVDLLLPGLISTDIKHYNSIVDDISTEETRYLYYIFCNTINTVY